MVRTSARKWKQNCDWLYFKKGIYAGLKQPSGKGEFGVASAQRAENETLWEVTQ